MKAPRRFAKNSLAGFVTYISNHLLSLLILSLLGRYLGPEGYGQYYYIYAFIMLITIGSDMGLRTIVIREIAKCKDNAGNIIGSALLLKLFLSLFTAVVFLVFAGIAVDADLHRAFFFALLAGITMTNTDVFIWVCRGYEKMEYETLFVFFTRTIQLFLVLWGINQKYDVEYFFVALLMSNLLRIALLCPFVLKKFSKPVFTANFQLWKTLLMQSAPLGFSAFLAITSRRVNIFILESLRPKDEVGCFAGSFAVTSALVFIPSVFMISAFPILSRMVKDSSESFESSLRMSFKYLFILSLPIVAVLFAFADRIISLIFGPAFSGSALVLQILCLSIPFRFFNVFCKYVLSSMNLQKIEFGGSAIGLSISCVVGYLVILRFGFLGAAVTLLFSEILMFLFKHVVLSRHVSTKNFIRVLLRPLLGLMIMSMVIYFFIDFSALLSLFLSLLVYPLSLYLLKSFTREEIDFFRRAVYSHRT
ncbi:flippase [Acidobacteriota bacterium]